MTHLCAGCRPELFDPPRPDPCAEPPRKENEMPGFITTAERAERLLPLTREAALLALETANGCADPYRVAAALDGWQYVEDFPRRLRFAVIEEDGTPMEEGGRGKYERGGTEHAVLTVMYARSTGLLRADDVGVGQPDPQPDPPGAVAVVASPRQRVDHLGNVILTPEAQAMADAAANGSPPDERPYCCQESGPKGQCATCADEAAPSTTPDPNGPPEPPSAATGEPTDTGSSWPTLHDGHPDFY